jgi:hypothetical protein
MAQEAFPKPEGGVGPAVAKGRPAARTGFLGLDRLLGKPHLKSHMTLFGKLGYGAVISRSCSSSSITETRSGSANRATRKTEIIP